MKTKNLVKHVIASLCLLTSMSAIAQAPTQVNCSQGLAYIINSSGESNTSDLYAFDLAAGTSTLIKAGIIPVADAFRYVNAIGYNPIDNYMYGFVMTIGKIIRLGANGDIQYLTVSDPNNLLPLGSNYVAGDVHSNGKYYIFNYDLQKLLSIDLTLATPVVVEETTIPAGTFINNNINDIVFSPIDGNMYGVTNGLELFRYNVTTHVVTKLGTVSGTSGTGIYGTAFMDNLGNMYIGNNLTGAIYKINTPNTIAVGSTITATAYSTAFAGFFPNDGARCMSYIAPSAQNDTTCAGSAGLAVTIDVAPNDAQGTYAINPGSVRLVNAANAEVTTLNVLGKGTFTVNTSTGIITFTPEVGFTGTAVVDYVIKDTQGNVSNKGKVVVNECPPGNVLPIDLSYLQAFIDNGVLQINWGTDRELNNSHFDIEVSNDGKTFRKIDAVDSKGLNGTSDTPLNYSFSTNTTTTAVLGLSLLGLGLAAAAGTQRRKKLYNVLIIGGVCMMAISACSKQDTVSNSTQHEVFVRLKQVDKDGSFKYSKVVKATVKH